MNRGSWGFTARPHPAIVGRPEATRQASGTQNVYRAAIQANQFIFAPPTTKGARS